MKNPCQGRHLYLHQRLLCSFLWLDRSYDQFVPTYRGGELQSCVFLFFRTSILFIVNCYSWNWFGNYGLWFQPSVSDSDCHQPHPAFIRKLSFIFRRDQLWKISSKESIIKSVFSGAPVPFQHTWIPSSSFLLDKYLIGFLHPKGRHALYIVRPGPDWPLLGMAGI